MLRLARRHLNPNLRRARWSPARRALRAQPECVSFAGVRPGGGARHPEAQVARGRRALLLLLALLGDSRRALVLLLLALLLGREGNRRLGRRRRLRALGEAELDRTDV